MKASGGDLGSATRTGFASLYEEKVLALERRFRAGLDEDSIVPLYMRAVFDSNPAAPSIDTPLHAFVPNRCVSHMHSDAVISVAANEHPERLMGEIYGQQMGFLPWKRPGFQLGLMLRDLIEEHPNINSALMAQHGFICWAETWEECYSLTIRVINQAVEFIEHKKKAKTGHAVQTKGADASPQILLDFLPELRGRVAYQGQRQVASVDTSASVVEFTQRRDFQQLAAMGTSCPDHFLRTKIRPLVLTDPINLSKDLEAFRAAYESYYERWRVSCSPAMRNPNPSVVLIRGVGMVSFGRSAQEAKVTGEFYRNAIEVINGAEEIGRYVALPEQEAFNIEYWLLEQAKIERQPPEKELSRRIALLVGAGPGIGRAVANRLLANGACVAIADFNSALVDEAVSDLVSVHGDLGVQGLVFDKKDRFSVKAALDQVVLRFGGLDLMIDIAAVFIPPDLSGRVSDAGWAKTYEVNLVGTYVVADECFGVMRRQGITGRMVFVSSANGVVAKHGSVAYDTSKAAVNHLVRELAIEYSPLVSVNAVAPATVVAGSQMFPRERVLSSLVKYNIEHSDKQSDEDLRSALAAFYAQRTLLKQPVSPITVADAIYLLATDRLSQTTGHIMPVDAGLPEAFLR